MTTTEQSYATSPQLAETLKKYQQIATFVGLVFLLLTISGYFFAGPQQFLRSYLVGFYFWFGVGLGSLVLLMIHFVSGGAWGMMIRRPLEAGTRTLYVMWLLFLPLLILAPKLYFWADPAHAADKIVQAKHLYLNVPFLWIRWLIYGAIWLGLTTLLNRWSRLEDETKSVKYSSLLEKLSGPGIVAYFFTITFASVDYLMSLDVTWASTIYGFLVAAGQGLSAISVMVATLVLLGKYTPMNHLITKRHLHDLGKLMLAIVMLWAYLSFSQYLIIYSGNLPQEINWYVRRLNGGWQWVGLTLLLLHFALPFALLLSQSLKKNPKTISAIAIFIICIRIVDVFWLVEPNFQDVNHPVFTVSWLDFTAPIGFGGLWLALFFRTLPTRPLLPLGAPDLQKALSHGREH
ncbi:MAG: hypothetical protein ABSG41_01490 [Bryobacteraceae bacterium]|jgi:hypothetical protein